MYLKSLELSGFKSFAKKTILEFKTPITAVVGPNGSGKSNIAEAFSFVLGEQSVKSMRGKRTEDLIWNGGGDASRSNRASVKVVFDNRTRLLNLDFDEVSVERTVYRDASSEYFINGSRVRLRDVVELLSAAHVGSSGHHIISQGEADRVLNASGRERREMIEDALGLKIYQYKREESERKLLKTEENLKSAESLRREIAPHLKFLKKQVEKIEHAATLRGTLVNLCKEYFKRERLYLEHHRDAILSAKTKPLSELRRLEKELVDAKKILSAREGRDEKSEEVMRIESELSELRLKKDSLVRDLGRLEGAIESEERMSRREREAPADGQRVHVPLTEVEEVKTRIEEKIGEALGRPDEVSLAVLFSFIRKVFAELVSKYRSKSDARANRSERETERLFDEKRKLEEKLESLQARETLLRESSETLKAEMEREKDKSREAERLIFKVMSEENLVRSALAELAAKEEKISALEGDFKRDLHEAALLLGREVLDFNDVRITDKMGAAINPLAITGEDRVTQEERRRQIEKMKIRLEETGTVGAEETLREHKEVSERDAFLEREIADLEASAASLRKLITELAEKLDSEFREGISKINAEFGHFFTLMFGGGRALLQLVREERRKRSDTGLSLAIAEDGADEATEETDEGELPEAVEIEVSLPRKKIKGLMMLSGGERALTSIALLFAMTRVNPPPFVILDETDAALDEANSKKYGDMIESLAKLSELILITHNRETMSRAGVLYGVTMGQGGASKILSVELAEALVVAN